MEIAAVLTEPERERLFAELERLLGGASDPVRDTGFRLMTPAVAREAGMTWPGLDAPAPAVLSASGG